MSPIRTVIAGTGSHIPSVCVKNDHFLRHDFRGPDQKKIDKPNAEIVGQFEAITGIRERRYVPDDLVTSDIALGWGRLTAAAQKSGRPLPVVDGLLLATAQAHGLTFATRITKDVEGRGVAVLNPYSTP